MKIELMTGFDFKHHKTSPTQIDSTKTMFVYA